MRAADMRSVRNGPGVPLAHYIEHHTTTGVRFTCEACQARHDVPMDRVVASLKAHGLGDEQTGVRELARLLGRPCTRCGQVRWETRPAWYAFRPR